MLTESADGRKYWNKLKQRLREEGNESVTNCHQLKLLSLGHSVISSERASDYIRPIEEYPTQELPFEEDKDE